MRLLIIVFGFILSLAACAQEAPEALAAKYQEGVHYKVLPQVVKTITPGKIEVTEAFAYTCGHCYKFESLINNWKSTAPADVQFVKLPVIWRPSMQSLARIMYTGEALKMSSKLNARVFEVIHQERKNLASESDIASVFEGLGVPPEKFKKTFNSFGVSAKVQQADARTRSMNVTGTPQMIVDGKYTVSASKDLGHEGMLKVVDFLVEKVRAEKVKG